MCEAVSQFGIGFVVMIFGDCRYSCKTAATALHSGRGRGWRGRSGWTWGDEVEGELNGLSLLNLEWTTDLLGWRSSILYEEGSRVIRGVLHLRRRFLLDLTQSVDFRARSCYRRPVLHGVSCTVPEVSTD